MRAIPPVVFVLAAVVAAGCTMMGEAPASKWSPTSPLKAPRQQYMSVMKSVVERAGFTVEAIDEAQGTLVTTWRVQLRPQWRQGFRDRVHMRIEQTPKSEQIINVQVERERNENSSRPMSASNAEWVAWGSNDGLSEELAYRLFLKLEKPKVDD